MFLIDQAVNDYEEDNAHYGTASVGDHLSGSLAPLLSISVALLLYCCRPVLRLTHLRQNISHFLGIMDYSFIGLRLKHIHLQNTSCCCPHSVVLTLLSSLCCPHSFVLTLLSSLCWFHSVGLTLLSSLCWFHSVVLTRMSSLCWSHSVCLTLLSSRLLSVCRKDHCPPHGRHNGT